MQTHAYALLGSACLIACGAVGAATFARRQSRDSRRDARSPAAPGARRSRRGSEAFCANSPASINGGRTPSCISKCGTSSPDSASPSQLVAFDESGEVRTLYPVEGDRFFAGPGAAVSTSVESQIEFQRDNMGKIVSLRWRRADAAPRAARRVEVEKHEDVRFSSGDIQLAGTLIRPAKAGKVPIVILVHGSGAENRDYMLPWARFLVRRGIGVLAYDKRGRGRILW